MEQCSLHFLFPFKKKIFSLRFNCGSAHVNVCWENVVIHHVHCHLDSYHHDSEICTRPDCFLATTERRMAVLLPSCSLGLPHHPSCCPPIARALPPFMSHPSLPLCQSPSLVTTQTLLYHPVCVCQPSVTLPKPMSQWKTSLCLAWAYGVLF